MAVRTQFLGLRRYVRLELLEGVAAYHSGDRALARAKLRSSQQRWLQLQVSDECLAELMSMGFNSQEVRLRLCRLHEANSNALRPPLLRH